MCFCTTMYYLIIVFACGLGHSILKHLEYFLKLKCTHVILLYKLFSETGYCHACLNNRLRGLPKCDIYRPH